MREGVVVADGPPGTVFAPANVDLLASTGLTPPPAARIAARLGAGDRPARRGLAAGRPQGWRLTQTPPGPS